MEKTRIGRIDDGFDFLSFNIRRYHTQSGTKVLTRPSRGAVSKIRQRITEELRALRGASPIKVINKMNPVIRGQANYFRPGASKKAYQTLDSHLWQNLYKWARRRHPKKGRKPAPTSISTPGQRSSGTSRSPAGTHPMTLPWPSTGPTGDESKNPRQLAPSWHHALRDQAGQCPLCREPLLFTGHVPDSPGQWETWYAAIRKAMTRQAITEQDTGRTKHRLVHAHCARRHPDTEPQGTDQ